MNTDLQRLIERSQAGETIPSQNIADWFTTLPPVADLNFMLGPWTGGVFNTGHPGEPLLKKLGWVGKHFHSPEAVDPIVCLDAEGHRLANPVMGAARLRLIPAPGESTPTAAMVYDTQPIIDHFKWLDEGTVLGVMDRKGDGVALYFFLRRGG